MESLRKPFFIAALILIALTILAEVGTLGILRGNGEPGSLDSVLPPDGELAATLDELDEEQRAELDVLAAQGKPPGMAIPYMALLDGLLLFTIALMSVGMLVRERIHSRIQGAATLLFSLLIIIAAIGLILVAVATLLMMIALLLAVPFGTLVYLVRYGFFNRGGASVALGLLMSLKLGFAICLALAQQRFLENKGLVLLILTSFVANVIVSFLHGIVPRFLVSITDGVGAIVVAVLAALWAIFLLVGSIGSVVKALRFDRV
jgi:hypothetical protein